MCLTHWICANRVSSTSRTCGFRWHGKLGYFAGDWGFSLVAIPEVRFSKLPPYGSDFYQGAAKPPPEQVPHGRI